MADSNAHTPVGLPLVLFNADLGGGRHVRYDGAPLTNLYMTMLDKLGVPVERIGDSTGQLNGLSTL
jgi:hypothetical protein